MSQVKASSLQWTSTSSRSRIVRDLLPLRWPNPPVVASTFLGGSTSASEYLGWPLQTMLIPCSTRTDEAFAAKHLSDMGEATEDFTVFTWRLGDYRRTDKKVLSPDFWCAGHKW
jgi:hypothetical protein